MRKFLKFTLLFIIPIIAIAVLMEIGLRSIPNDYTYKKEYLDKEAERIKVLILGSSHTYYGIDPEFIKEKSFNASHISQLLYLDYQIYKKYEDRMDSLTCIVIPIDYQSLYGRLRTGPESWRFKNYNIYYGLQIGYDLADHSEVLGNKLPFNLERLWNYSRKGETARTCTDLGWGTNFNSKDNKDLEATGKMAGTRHTVDHDLYFNRNLGILKTFIASAKAKGVKIIFISCPVYKSYVEHMNRDHLEKTLETIAALSAEHPHTSYYDMMSDKRFYPEDFYDADHLNEIGAKKFSKLVDSIINVTVSSDQSKK